MSRYCDTPTHLSLPRVEPFERVALQLAGKKTLDLFLGARVAHPIPLPGFVSVAHLCRARKLKEDHKGARGPLARVTLMTTEPVPKRPLKVVPLAHATIREVSLFVGFFIFFPNDRVPQPKIAVKVCRSFLLSFFLQWLSSCVPWPWDISIRYG